MHASGGLYPKEKVTLSHVRCVPCSRQYRSQGITVEVVQCPGECDSEIARDAGPNDFILANDGDHVLSQGHYLHCIRMCAVDIMCSQLCPCRPQ